MKKTILTLTIILGMTLGTVAQQSNGGGLFGRGDVPQDQAANYRNGSGLILPGQHGLDGDQNSSPLGSGIAVLVSLGAAYLVGKKRREE